MGSEQRLCARAGLVDTTLGMEQTNRVTVTLPPAGSRLIYLLQKGFLMEVVTAKSRELVARSWHIERDESSWRVLKISNFYILFISLSNVSSLRVGTSKVQAKMTRFSPNMSLRKHVAALLVHLLMVPSCHATGKRPNRNHERIEGLPPGLVSSGPIVIRLDGPDSPFGPGGQDPFAAFVQDLLSTPPRPKKGGNLRGSNSLRRGGAGGGPTLMLPLPLFGGLLADDDSDEDSTDGGPFSPFSLLTGGLQGSPLFGGGGFLGPRRGRGGMGLVSEETEITMTPQGMRKKTIRTDDDGTVTVTTVHPDGTKEVQVTKNPRKQKQNQAGGAKQEDSSKEQHLLAGSQPSSAPAKMNKDDSASSSSTTAAPKVGVELQHFVDHFPMHPSFFQPDEVSKVETSGMDLSLGPNSAGDSSGDELFGDLMLKTMLESLGQAMPAALLRQMGEAHQQEQQAKERENKKADRDPAPTSSSTSENQDPASSPQQVGGEHDPCANDLKKFSCANTAHRLHCLGKHEMLLKKECRDSIAKAVPFVCHSQIDQYKCPADGSVLDCLSMHESDLAGNCRDSVDMTLHLTRAVQAAKKVFLAHATDHSQIAAGNTDDLFSVVKNSFASDPTSRWHSIFVLLMYVLLGAAFGLLLCYLRGKVQVAGGHRKVKASTGAEKMMELQLKQNHTPYDSCDIEEKMA
ncbi:unnamed protein product [Amoebophrya sp. A120]|nr:unnamed protein product [Amoebophrya sp. A120]|eukprot:GSA120T00005099001.1